MHGTYISRSSGMPEVMPARKGNPASAGERSRSSRLIRAAVIPEFFYLGDDRADRPRSSRGKDLKEKERECSHALRERATHTEQPRRALIPAWVRKTALCIAPIGQIKHREWLRSTIKSRKSERGLSAWFTKCGTWSVIYQLY